MFNKYCERFHLSIKLALSSVDSLRKYRKCFLQKKNYVLGLRFSTAQTPHLELLRKLIACAEDVGTRKEAFFSNGKQQQNKALNAVQKKRQKLFQGGEQQHHPSSTRLLRWGFMNGLELQIDTVGLLKFTAAGQTSASVASLRGGGAEL